MARTIHVGEAVWRFDDSVLERAGTPIRLTRLERDLLGHLANRVGVVVSSSELLCEVWGYSSTVQSRAVESAVSRLRKKLGADADRIQTIYGQGYCLLPTEDRSLIGREDELSQLATLCEDHRVINVYGVGGVGKTELVRCFVQRRPRPVWLEFHASHDVEEVAYKLARQLGGAGTGADPLALPLQTLGRANVVLDGAEHVGPALLDAVRRWAGVADESRWLLTSRRLFADETGLELRPLKTPAAVRLLCERAPTGIDDASSPVLEELVHLVDRLPLGIELAAARLRVLPPQALVDWLREHGVDIIDSGTGRLMGALHGCWSLLDESERRCLTVAAHLGHRFRAGPVGRVAGLTPARTLDALEGLLRTGTVARAGEVYSMLDLVRSFAASRFTPRLRPAFVRYAVEEARRVVEESAGGLLPSSERLQDLVPTLQTAMVWATDIEDRAYLALAIFVHDRHLGVAKRAEPWLRELTTLDLPPTLRCEVLGHLANLCVDIDDRERALEYATEARAAAAEIGDPELEARHWRGLVDIVRMQQGPGEALPMARAVVEHVESHELSDEMRSLALSSLEACLTPLGLFEEAHRCLLQSIAWAPATPEAEASYRTRLGFVLNMQGDLEASRRELERAFRIATDAGLERRIVTAGRQLGNLLSNLGEDARAKEVYEIVAEHSRHLGLSVGLLAARNGLATLVARSDPARAIQDFVELREHALVLGLPREAAVASLNVAMLRHRTGRWELAEQAYRETLTIIEPIGWRFVIAMARSLLAVLLAGAGRRADAEAELAAARPGSKSGQRIRDAAAAAIRSDRDACEEHLGRLPDRLADEVRATIARSAAARHSTCTSAR